GTISWKDKGRVGKRHPAGGAKTSHMADGQKDHGRFRHIDEQGTGSDRGPLVVRAFARQDRRAFAPEVTRSCPGRVPRRFGAGPNVAAGHEAANPVCANVAGSSLRTGETAELGRIV